MRAGKDLISTFFEKKTSPNLISAIITQNPTTYTTKFFFKCCDHFFAYKNPPVWRAHGLSYRKGAETVANVRTENCV